MFSPFAMDYSELTFLNLEDCLYLEEQQPLGSWNGLPSLFEYEYLLPYQKSNPSNYELTDFEEISCYFDLWDSSNLQSPHNEIVVDDTNTTMGDSPHENVVYGRELSVSDRNINGIKRVGRYKCCALELDEIQKYFDVPISKAAKELNVGLTVLKKRCRELNIMRWPHRKIKSVKCLIDNVKELGLSNEIELLEEHKRMLEQLPEMELTERTKKLRQACFKANYKKRRSMQA